MKGATEIVVNDTGGVIWLQKRSAGSADYRGAQGARTMTVLLLRPQER
jgi:hypothetical protein